MPSSSPEIELFPLSWLSQYLYCPRRCGLLAVEQAWADNEFTAEGSIEHERVHTARVERKGQNLYLYETPVFSRKIGVNGKCDCVEAYYDENGVSLPYGEGKFTLYPVEYKHGVVRNEFEYKIQLCGQAMCLEEQFSCRIPKGAIFYIDAHRRDEVLLTQELREATLKAADSIRSMISSGTCPAAKYSAKCKKCSMLEYCQPKLIKSAKSYCANLLSEIKEGRYE